MGVYLSTPRTEKASEDGENDRLRYGLSSMQGWRATMEDAHAAFTNLDGTTSFFGVYDGHGGKEVSKFCAKFLHRQVMEHEASAAGDLGTSVKKAFLRMDQMMCGKEMDQFKVRKLEISDKQKGFVELLQQLTVCGSISDEAFEERFHELAKCGDDHVISVIEDKDSGKIVGTGSVFIEMKFIRNCGKVGHIEDVVVDSSVRGKQLGKKIVGFLSDHAMRMGCYKVILDCSVDNRLFYERCGFKQKEVQMVKYFNS